MNLQRRTTIRRLAGRGMSDTRRYLWVALLEGFPAIIIQQLLGGPFLTGYLIYLGASAQQIGIVLAITTLVNVAQIFIAYFMQKVTNRRYALLIFGTLFRILWTGTGLIPFLVPKDWWVPVYILVYTLAHLCNATGGILWSSLISDMVPNKVMGKYFGIRNTVHFAAGALALYAGGQILDHYPKGDGFSILFAVCAVCTVINVVAYWYYPNLPFEKSESGRFFMMLGKPFADSSFLKTILFLSVWLFLQGVAVPLFSYVMLDVMKIGYQWVSIYTVVQTVVMMIGYYVWGNLNAKYSSQTLLFWTLPIIALSCAVWGAMAVLPAFVVLTLAHVLLGVGTGGFNQLVFNYIIGDTPKSERPMYLAVYAALTGFAAFLGPILGGWLYKALKDMPLEIQTYGVSLGIGLLLLILSFAGRPIFLARSR